MLGRPPRDATVLGRPSRDAAVLVRPSRDAAVLVRPSRDAAVLKSSPKGCSRAGAVPQGTRQCEVVPPGMRQCEVVPPGMRQCEVVPPGMRQCWGRHHDGLCCASTKVKEGARRINGTPRQESCPAHNHVPCAKPSLAPDNEAAMAVLDIPEVVPPGTLPPSCRVRLIPRGTLMIVPQGMPNPTAPGRFGPKYS